MMDPGTISPPASRNSLCPCGSGLRYKNCHGALAEDKSTLAAATAPPARRMSSYRAPVREWPEMSEEERDRLGAIMERALAHQLAVRIEDAERDYRTVLERAPDTHDALHMLGVIELGRDNLDEAERLIRRAMAVRIPHPAIVGNLKLVEEAKLVHLRESPELLCERALPIFADLVLGEAVGGRRAGTGRRAAGTVSGEIHLIGRVNAPLHDDGWLLQRLAQMIDARIWAIDAEGIGRFADRPWRGIDAGIGSYPRFGTHVIVGIDSENFAWLDRVEPTRVIVFCSGVAPSACLDQLRRIAGDGGRAVELAFFSAAEAARFGGGHHVITPPVEIPSLPQSMANPEPARGVWRIEKAAPFRIGMVGQARLAVLEADVGKGTQSLRHYCDELAIYDPGRLRFVDGDARNVNFVPRKPGALNSFLSGLDALVLQPRVWYYEGGMHEFFGARALGVPVLCPKASRWAEYIEDRVDGLCYESHGHLLSLLGDLKTAPGWAEDMGAAARTRALAELDPARMRRTYAEWVGGVLTSNMPDGKAVLRMDAA